MRLAAPAHALELRAEVAPSFVRLELSADAELLGDVEDEATLDDEHADGDVIYRAVGGRWRPTAHTLAVGDGQHLSYVDADGCWPGRRLRDGTRELADFLVATFPGARSYGGYNCRATATSSSTSARSARCGRRGRAARAPTRRSC